MFEHNKITISGKEYYQTILKFKDRTVYYLNGKCHREDGPAIEFADGDKFWYKDSKYHRDDGPAIESANGSKEWYKYGKLHRDDGPAVEDANGDKEWWLNDELYSKEEYDKQCINIKKQQ